jgi:hypothetical protein
MKMSFVIMGLILLLGKVIFKRKVLVYFKMCRYIFKTSLSMHLINNVVDSIVVYQMTN